MFKRHPRDINSITTDFLLQNSLATPLLQYRLLKAWDEVVGTLIARYTLKKDIRNQTLWVKISSPALRQDMQMQCSELTRKLNAHVGSNVITDIKIY